MVDRNERKPTHDSIAKLYQEATAPTSGEQRRKWTEYRKVDGDEAERLEKATGLSLAGYAHTVDESAIRHIVKGHGINAKLPHDQLPVTGQDIEHVGDIIAAATRIENDENLLRYEADLGRYLIVVEEIRTGKKELALKTMRKYFKKPDREKYALAEPSASTSETTGLRPRPMPSTKADQAPPSDGAGNAG